MPYPRLHDDGRYVTLDLHGATRSQARQLIPRVLQEALNRGRDRVQIIHGYSTANSPQGSIKSDLYEMIDSGVLDEYYVSITYDEGSCTLGLPLSLSPDPSPITWQDLQD